MSAWTAAEVITHQLMNQKTLLVDTGANIAAATPYTGMMAYCTSTGSGFTSGIMYQYNGSAWVQFLTYPPTWHEIWNQLTTKNRAFYFDPCQGVLKPEWIKTLGTGSGTFALQNAIDGGYVTTNSNGASDAVIVAWSGSVLPFDYQNCEMTFESSISVTTVYYRVGLGTGFTGNGLTTATVRADSTINANYNLETITGGTTNTVDTGVAVDANIHTFKILVSSTNVKLYIDGVLKATSTTDLPATAMMPGWSITNRTTNTPVAVIRNIEVRNL